MGALPGNGVADPSDLPEIPLAGDVSPCAAHGCSRCCHDVEMLLTESDVARIAAVRPDVDFWFQADDGYLQLRVADRPPVAGQRLEPGAAGKPCVFLDEVGRCTIHAVRPEGCRLYPAVFDDPVPRAILDDEYCPHTDGFALDGEVHQTVQALADTLNEERDARVTE